MTMTDKPWKDADDRPAGSGSPGGWRLAAVLAFTGLLAWLGWQVIVNTSPRPFGGATGAAAAGDLVRRVEQQVLEGDVPVDWAEVRRSAQQMLRDNPLESRAIFLMGLAADAEGREDEAAELMGMAAARSLRDRRAHLWLFGHRLRRQEFGPALGHADVILRTRPQLGSHLLPAMMAIASVSEGRSRLIEMLETAPAWRKWFLRQFSRQADDPAAALPIYAALQAGPNPPTSDELQAHLDRLIGAGAFEQALLLWLGSLDREDMQALGYVYNGDFERPVSNLAFDWVIGRVRGADIEVAESDLDRGKALRVQFARSRIPFRHVRKLVVLRPGTYRLTGKARALDLRSERGLVWTLTCAEGSNQVLAETNRVAGTMEAEISQDFTVPAHGCRAQWLRLELAARIASERDVGGGTVWYDALRVQRIN